MNVNTITKAACEAIIPQLLAAQPGLRLELVPFTDPEGPGGEPRVDWAIHVAEGSRINGDEMPFPVKSSRRGDFNHRALRAALNSIPHLTAIDGPDGERVFLESFPITDDCGDFQFI